MEKITGKNNDLIKDIKKLLSSSRERKEKNAFVLEGVRLVFDVLNSAVKVKAFFVTNTVLEKYPSQCDKMINSADNSYLISDETAGRISDTKTAQGIFAVCEMKSQNFSIYNDSRYIALDNVQDPGNLGTIVRTAEALGIDGIIIFCGCDIYNPKVLRASMGSILRMNIIQTDSLPDTIRSMKNNGMKIYATSPDSCAKSITAVDFSHGCVCVIGNEANGVSDEVMKCCDDLITIRMLGKSESLNVSAAAAIIIWEMLK